MRKRTKGLLMGISLILLGFFFVPAFRSEVVMRPVSFLADRESVMGAKGFEIILPDGSDTQKKDWTSSIKVFNPRIFELAEGPVSATILYNFGAFSHGRSTLYDPRSPYEMAFYGAYAVSRQGDDDFGFEEEGTINLSELSLIPLYDLEVLVLGGLGCPRDLAQADLLSYEMKVEEDGPLAGWVRVDLEVDTRSPIHGPDGWNQNDLQYGPPPTEPKEDFAPLRLKGRIYAKSFSEWESSLFLYVFAKDQAVIDKTDQEFLQNVQIKERTLWEH